MESADLQHLLRWIDAGGAYEIVAAGEDWVEVDLLTCGGDEVMGTLRSSEPDLRAHLARVGEEE